MRDWILAIPPEAIDGMFALGRRREVDAAVREGLKRAKSTAAAAIFVTGGGKYAFEYPNVMVCAYARQAWREQHP